MLTGFWDSPGGNLIAGLKLGQIFRDRNLSTFVGRAVRKDPLSVVGRFAVGECYSACAYAFLGGSNRFVPEGSLLGFHQFYWDPQATFHNPSAEATATESQRLSGLIAGYIARMGVDGTLLWAASGAQSDDLYIPKFEELVALQIVTIQGFDKFTLIPVGEGVAAQALRRHDDLHRDPYVQVIAFCWGGDSFLYFTSANAVPAMAQLDPNRTGRESHQIEKAEFIFDEEVSSHDMYFLNHGLDLDARLDRMSPSMEVNAIWWADSESMDGSNPVTIKLSESLLTALYERRQLYFWLQVARASGSYFAFIDLSQEDVDRLRAAFRFCVQTDGPNVSKPTARGSIPGFDCSKAGSLRVICGRPICGRPTAGKGIR